MSLGLIKRNKATVKVTVRGKPRSFVLRAQSIAEHLELVELQKEARLKALSAAALVEPDLLSAAALAWADLAASLVVATHLLQEPADRGDALSEEDGWDLEAGDPERVISLQRELTDIERLLAHVQSAPKQTTAEEVAGSWLDVASTIAQARLAPDAQMPLTSWSVHQLLETHYRALAILWRENAMKITLAGGKPGKEPDFRTGKRGHGGVDSAPFTEEDEVRYAKMKAEVEDRLNASPQPVLPGAM